MVIPVGDAMALVVFVLFGGTMKALKDAAFMKKLEQHSRAENKQYLVFVPIPNERQSWGCQLTDILRR